MEKLAASFSGVKAHKLLEGVSGFDPDDEAHVRQLRAACAKYAAARWLERGVARVDICGFTRVSSPRQLSYILSLDRAMRTAFRRLKAASARTQAALGVSLPLDFSRSTTGDGYYLWNEVWGTHGDAALLALLLQTMSVIEQRRTEPREQVLRARGGFHRGRGVPGGRTQV